MDMLFVNHGAKGIAMWDYPTEPGIANITGQLSKVLTSKGISSFLLGSFEQKLDVSGLARVDVASWTVRSNTLVSVVNKNYVDSAANLSIALPIKASSVSSVVWGSGWTVSGNTLTKVGMNALEVDIFVVS